MSLLIDRNYFTHPVLTFKSLPLRHSCPAVVGSLVGKLVIFTTVPSIEIVAPDGILIVSPDAPKVNVVPVLGCIKFVSNVLIIILQMYSLMELLLGLKL